MPIIRFSFMVAIVLATFVPFSSVTALELAEIARALPAVDSPAPPPTVEGLETAPDLPQPRAESPEKTPMQRLLDGEYPVLRTCQVACKNRYFKEIKKCRRLLSTTFKRELCIRRANEYGRTCRSICK
ncbi:MAG: hypothetical protein ACE5G9_13940 [Nitrospinales bacterium]